ELAVELLGPVRLERADDRVQRDLAHLAGARRAEAGVVDLQPPARLVAAPEPPPARGAPAGAHGLAEGALGVLRGPAALAREVHVTNLASPAARRDTGSPAGRRCGYPAQGPPLRCCI